MTIRSLMVAAFVFFPQGIAFADMMERPWFGTADYYLGAYFLGLILLTLVTLATWFILKRMKRNRRFLLCGAVLVAIIAALALREDYHMSRAESCFYLMQRALHRRDRHAALHGYGRGAVSVSIHPSGIGSTYGTPPQVVAFLRRKYSNWFSGSLIRIRNAFFGVEMPSEEELGEVENMPVPQMIPDDD